MNNFRFANPNWGQAIWLVIGIVTLLLWLDQRGSLALNRFLSPGMQSRLALRSSRPRRWAAVLCLGLAAACLVVALMRPQWGLTFHRTPRVGAQIMICLDVSRSMLAEDTAPNRLERAKAEILDMLTFLEGDQVGLIAFAGKASVLCPLTPDFGFFRLILNDAGPHSVGLGGTILSAPLRKALDGFRGDSEASRVMMVITDGEDHAQHTGDLEQVAKLATERGIKVIAIGFGDEQGSQIEYTDPVTGGRTKLRDADGNEVITRLDGETLRNLALTTEGVYIPAGTGLLDLESIYDTHIASLVRGSLDDRGRAVRRDVFQWAILSGLLLLLLSIWLAHAPTSPISSANVQRSVTATAAVFALLMTIRPPASVASDSPLPDASAEPVSEGTANQDTPAQTGTVESDVQIPKQPRQAYNFALARLDNDLDAADQLLSAARRQAGTDGEVRYRATYNLGWLAIHRADRSLPETPHESLQHLNAAADWFREAIRLRPESDVARHNLEVVLRRALQLADSLNQQESVILAERLDQLIGAQRELLVNVRRLVEKASSENDPHIVHALKSEFRELAIQQRQLLSDSDAVAEQANSEQDTIMSKKHDERTAEERLRAVQLKNLQHHFFQAVQRMGQTRSQLRRKQTLRAYRRATSALSRLKRARDQLRDPVERLSTIITDADRLAREMRAYAMVRQGSVSSIDTEPLPTWLDQEYLEQEQAPTTERTEELAALWDSMLAEHPTPLQGPALPGTANEPNQPSSSPEAEQLLEKIQSAKPLVSHAVDQFRSAGTTLKSDRALQAYEHQLTALAALVEARELFLNLKQTIELAYAEERRIQSIVALENPADVEDLKTFQEMLPLATEFQQKNIERGTRIGQLIDESLAKLSATMGPPTAQQTDQGQASDTSRQQLQTAQQLLEQALGNMRRANHLLDATPHNTGETNVESEVTLSKVPAGSAEESDVSVQPTGDSPQEISQDSIDDTAGKPSTDSAKEPGTDSAAAGLDTAVGDAANTADAERDSANNLAVAVNAAVDNLQALRRLFYSIVEHLRETADRQAELNDETERARTPANTPLEQRLGPLVDRQSELARIAEGIASALQSQASQTPESAGGQNDDQPLTPDQQKHAAAVSQQLEQAGQLVGKATDDMQSAAVEMSQQQSDLDSARNRQDQALEKLAEAIALLVPPQQKQQQQNNDEQQQDQQDQQDENQQNQAQDQPQVDPRRLLQAVRDREAQRRHEKSKRGQTRRGAVEKDW